MNTPTYTDRFSVPERASPSYIVGQLLKFADGRYKVDKIQDLPPGGRYCAVNVATVWVRWADKKPAEHLITTPGQHHPERDELGDLDQSKWPMGLNGQPDDPWKDTRYVHLVNQKTGADYTFVTDSHGGRRAVGDLKSQIANIRNEHRQALPIIELGSVSWKTKFGSALRPAFHVVSWVERRGGGQLFLDRPEPEPDWPDDPPDDYHR